MRKTILALTVIFLAPTAVMALTASREQVGAPELGATGAAIQKRQVAPGDVAGSGHGGILGGNVILAKGDKSGTGPGRGGHKGAHKGEHKGGQKHDKS
ncbi:MULTISPECIES: hypothetical protein [unclassified Bradyrhizobium]|uniref:hypothetical protein n=1 Tax=unclassified Bradyrhizobium TaxID=2631580 RepID=UPI002479C201|nr:MULTISPECIES: hypothetical protein [unclassified Bradyrhizobium]WGR70242.1 hypothetical protein MTX24_33390 [Bradyrhizobium sp. ISRA426]WGR82301.1 hypothetical protein MTX21_18495 [Bradyrhizobium sp. ISRA430]WGR85486.1 hypothetical protein MTX25_33070 [Bradyrhizobium sp. ISRA432]